MLNHDTNIYLRLDLVRAKHLERYCVFVVFFYNIVSQKSQFPLSFQDITLVCLKYMSTCFNYQIYS